MKIGDSVLLSLFIYSSVVCEIVYAPPPPPTLAPASAVFDFQSNQKEWAQRSQRKKNIIRTMMKYGEMFYGRHTVLNTSCSEVK